MDAQPVFRIWRKPFSQVIDLGDSILIEYVSRTNVVALDNAVYSVNVTRSMSHVFPLCTVAC